MTSLGTMLPYCAWAVLDEFVTLPGQKVYLCGKVKYKLVARCIKDVK
jgi:hypothetical protein